MPRGPRNLDDKREVNLQNSEEYDPLSPRLNEKGLKETFSLGVPKDRKKYLDKIQMNKKEILLFLQLKGDVTWLDSWKKYTDICSTTKDKDIFKRYYEELKLKVEQIRNYITYQEEKKLETSNSYLNTTADFYGG